MTGPEPVPADPYTRDPGAPASFADAMAQLERCVRRLEAGDLPIEAALELYEEGVRLQALCADLLARRGPVRASRLALREPTE